MTFSTIQEAIKDIKKGKIVIAVDNEHRENEGDMILAAELATPEKINFMIQEAKGLMCIPMKRERLNELNLGLMVSDEKNTELDKCKFTVSVDLKGTRSGISAFERHQTIKGLIDPKRKANDFNTPGHMFPLRYQEGGVLVRQGHTEASVDLCILAGLYPAAVICEVIAKGGHMANLKDLAKFSRKHGIKIIKVDDLVKYRKEQERKK